MNEENMQFPLAPAPFTGECREVDVGACFDWLRQGWALFAANPGAWIGSTVLLLVILLAIFIVPIFGQIGANLLLPIFGAGLLQLCRVQSEGGQAEIADIFIGFRKNAGPLVMVGVIYVAGVFGIAFIAFLLISGGVLGGVITGKVAGVGIALGAAMLAGYAGHGALGAGHHGDLVCPGTGLLPPHEAGRCDEVPALRRGSKTGCR
jgi:hypothetical protein